VSDRFDEDARRPAPSEGVRILGAEEAQAALDAGTARPAAEPSEPAPADAPSAASAPAPAAPPPAPVPWASDAGDDDGLDALAIDDDVEADEEPSERHPVRFPDDGPTWSASAATEQPTGEIPALPHWTEPPTGAVPAIFADDEEEGDADLDAWASLSGSQPRFRAEGADWAEADFVEGDLGDDQPRVGALSNEAPVDDDVAFEEALAARRGRRRAPAPARAPRAPRAARHPRAPRG
jgi:hypothetical protein